MKRPTAVKETTVPGVDLVIAPIDVDALQGVVPDASEALPRFRAGIVALSIVRVGMGVGALAGVGALLDRHLMRVRPRRRRRR